LGFYSTRLYSRTVLDVPYNRISELGAPASQYCGTAMSQTSRLELQREQQVKEARKALSDYALACEKHQMQPDPAKMQQLHAEAKRLQATVQPSKPAPAAPASVSLG
jgi:hypothetical protein